jgi:hypothetical protein
LAVKFGPKVPLDQRPRIEAQVRAHHASLHSSDPAVAATQAKVFQGYHTEGSTDKTPHATVSYHSGSPSGHNKLGDAHHLYEEVGGVCDMVLSVSYFIWLGVLSDCDFYFYLLYLASFCFRIWI